MLWLRFSCTGGVRGSSLRNAATVPSCSEVSRQVKQVCCDQVKQVCCDQVKQVCCDQSQTFKIYSL